MRELLLFFPAGTPTAAIMEGVEAACRYFAESEDMYRAFAVGKTVAEAAANRLFLEARAAKNTPTPPPPAPVTGYRYGGML